MTKPQKKETPETVPDLPSREGSFVALLKADFAAHGAEVIEIVRRKHPTIYLRLVADELPRELSKTALALGDIGDDELAKIIQDLRTSAAAADGRRAKPTQRRQRSPAAGRL